MVEVKESQVVHETVLRKRWKKFKGLKRGYYSLVILLTLYILSFFLPLLINNRALIVKYDNEYYFPIVSGYISGKTFNQDVPGEARYRKLKVQFQNDQESNNWVVLPLYPYSPFEDIIMITNNIGRLDHISMKRWKNKSNFPPK